jgi:hypothetical protein
MTFKTQRESDEFKQLSVMNPRLFDLVNCLATFSIRELNKSITITSIHRTQQEHEDLYKQTPNPPASSVHCQWEGCDIRSSDFTESERQRLLDFLNQFTFRNQKPVGMCHAISGGALHFHIQYGKTR